MAVKAIFFDFDGVIIDSMSIRAEGFREVLSAYPKTAVDALIQYHHHNGGLSRFHKFRYFFEEILQRPMLDVVIQELAQKFSDIMLVKLSNPDYLIEDTVGFIQKIYGQCELHIVSGSEQTELRKLCEKLSLSSYFVTISGSPTPKTKLVSGLLKKYLYQTGEVLLIGDSINDYEAAHDNNIRFLGYNNLSLQVLSDYYIADFKQFDLGVF